MGDKVNRSFHRDPLVNLLNLLEMLGESLKKAGFTRQRLYLETGEEPNLGYYANYKDHEFWAGVYASQTDTVTLTLQDKELDYPTDEMDLDDPAFLALNAAGQTAALAEFLKTGADGILRSGSRPPKPPKR